MTKNQIVVLIKASAESHNMSPKLLCAICDVESGFRESAMRYEPKWSYLLHEQSYANQLGITTETERQLQKFSYGLFQIMGSVLRENGYQEMLPNALDPIVNLTYAIKFIKKLQEKLPLADHWISAYNAGIGGVGTNPKYVEKVLYASRHY